MNVSENPSISKENIMKNLSDLFSEPEIFSQKNLKISENDRNQLYLKAKHLYDSGKYKDAQTLFSTLTLLDKSKPSFLWGLASSSLLLNELDLAIQTFLEYGALVPHDPLPYYYLSLCYEKLHDHFSALVALQVVTARASDVPQYQELKSKAMMIIVKLTNLIKEEGAIEKK